jgi:PTH1 family peptidyl-tRNA hydrolase
MKLIVGLGNPGRNYAGNRHNVGFMVVDELASRARASWSSKFKGEYARIDLGRESAVLLKPQTFMNLSGESVGAAAQFYQVAIEDIFVVHDELDVPYGELRAKLGGGHAGHNGLRSIFQHVAPKGDFPRLRFGIGRPKHGEVSAWVLSNFSSDESITLSTLIEKAADATEHWVGSGIAATMNRLNGAAAAAAKPKKPKPETPTP